MPLISLNMAITRLLGNERSPGKEIGRLVEVQTELRQLAEAARAELRVSKVGTSLLMAMASADWVPQPGVIPSLTYWPPHAALEALVEPSSDWPDSLHRFREAGDRWDRELTAYDERYAMQLDGLLEAGRTGVVKFFGRRHATRTSEKFPIPCEHFLNVLTIDGSRRHLIPTERIRGALPLYQPALLVNEAHDPVRTVFDVEVEDGDLARLMHPAAIAAAGDNPEIARDVGPGRRPDALPLPPAQARPQDQDLIQVAQELERRIGRIPKRVEDLKPEFDRCFPNLKDTIGEAGRVRKHLWPETTKGGRPRKRPANPG